jgi:hypothetical protein
MTFLDLYGNFLDQELGTADRVNLFTVAKRKAAINAAQLWFTKETACLQADKVKDLVSGVARYPLDGVLLSDPGNYLGLRAARARTLAHARRCHDDATGGERRFPAAHRTVAQQQRPGWRTSPPSTPECWYKPPRARWSLGLHPPPLIPAGRDGSPGAFVMKPDLLVSDTDVPFTITGNQEFPLRVVKTLMEPWHRALGFYAAHDLEKLRKDRTRSAAALVQAQAEVTNYLGSQHVPQSAVIQPMRTYRRPRHGSRTYGERFGRAPW